MVVMSSVVSHRCCRDVSPFPLVAHEFPHQRDTQPEGGARVHICCEKLTWCDIDRHATGRILDIDQRRCAPYEFRQVQGDIRVYIRTRTLPVQ